MLNKQTIKRILGFLSLAFIVRNCITLRRQLKKWKRAKKIALNLPTSKQPEEVKYSIDMYGMILRKLKVKSFKPDIVSKGLMYALLQIFRDEAKNEELYCNWAMNPNVTPLPVVEIYIKSGELARELLSTKNLDNLVKGRAYGIADQLIGRGVLSESGADWHSQRVILEKGFTDKLLNKQFPMVVKTAEDLVGRLKFLHDCEKTCDFVEINVIEEMLKATMDVLGRVAFSYDIGSLQCLDTKDAPLYNSFNTILNTLFLRIFSFPKQITRKILPSDENIAFNNSLTTLTNVIKNIIQKKKQQGNITEPTDLLDILLQGKTVDSTGKKISMSEKKIIENMKTMLFAGHDTTAAALTWGIHLLAKNPLIVNKILTEFNNCNKTISVDVLENCSYLNAVVLEVLRLYPSAVFTRSAKKEFQLGKYLIPPAVDLIVSPYLIHRTDKNVDKPDEFIPERWIKQDQKENLGLQAILAKATLSQIYLPFSLGKRNCVGRKLALLEIRVMLLHVLLNFELKEPLQKHKDFQDEPYIGLTLFPKGVSVGFKPRKP